MFKSLTPLPPDPILGLSVAYKADTNPNKIDLGMGVYRDAYGNTPVMSAVKKAEQMILKSQSTKAYVGPVGAVDYNDTISRMVLGDALANQLEKRRMTVQTPGGTGGLRLTADFIRKVNPDATVWVSDPTWANHSPLINAAGLKIQKYPYYNYETHSIRFDEMAECLRKIPKGDLVLLHGCCHNPSGADLSREQWLELTELFERRGIVPFIDFAYLGMGQGIEEDAFGVRLMAERLPEVVIVTSCSKNFGLYRERVGAVSIVSKDAQAATLTLNNASNIARGIYSMPPDHGAAIVAEILCDDELRPLWIAELSEMRDRLNDLRCLLANKLQERNAPYDFSFIAQEHGMFSFLGISKEQVIRLREEFHIYLVESSRINVAGVNQANVDTIADAIVAVL